MMDIIGAIKHRDKQNFRADLNLARKAELSVAEWLDSLNLFRRIQMVNKKGYDIIYQKNNGELRKIEVKRDFWVDEYISKTKKRKATDNICVELWSNFDVGNVGWIGYSDADYIYYVGNKYIYILNREKLQQTTYSMINMGQAAKAEPTLKSDTYEKFIQITKAPYNGNFKVRNAMISKKALMSYGCIEKIISRQESRFDDIAKKYNI